jgi:hypothetical protein
MVPLTIQKPIKGHKGDTFRELLDIWQEQRLCRLVPTESIYCWLEGEGNILLYDADRFDHLPDSWKVGLFGNPLPPKINGKSYRWTYFARRPRLLEARLAKSLPDYDERAIKSIFLGKIENLEQGKSRVSVSSDWPNYIEIFSCPVLIGDNLTYPFTQEEYLEKLSQSKFGLALPGYGKKCNREIELLALGTVPVVTPGVDTDGYHEPLIEDLHYLRVESPEEISSLIDSVDCQRWREMSRAGRSWYQRNCAPKAAWNLAMKILDSVGAW